MNRYLKRFGAITLGVALSIGLGVFSSAKSVKSAKAADSTITNFVATSSITSAGTNGGSGSAASANQDGITISSDGGYFTTTMWKIYSGKTFTISTSHTIKSLSLTFSGSYNGLNTSYTVNASSFSATTTKQTRITNLTVVYEASGGSVDPDPDPDPDPEEPEGVAYSLIASEQADNSSYTTYYDVTIRGVTWNAPGNQILGDYWRIGGKSLTNAERTITGKTAISKRVSSITVNHNGFSRNDFTAGVMKVEVSENASFSPILDTVTLTPTISKSTPGSFTFEEGTEAGWNANLYYKFTFTMSNPTTNNGGLDITSIIFYEGESSTGNPMRLQDENHQQGPFELTYGSSDEICLIPWDINGDTTIKSGITWTLSNETVVNHSTDGYQWLTITPKGVGSVQITASVEGFKDAKATVNVVPGTLEILSITGNMTKTSYYVGESWNAAGLTVTANYDSGYSYDATSEVSWSFNPSAPALSVTSVTATATLGSVSSGKVQAVTVTRTNPIQALYTKSQGDTVTNIYGYYVGALNSNNIVIMDGEYGIDVYKGGGISVSGYTEKVTIIKVSGTISIYHGLYEISASSITTVESADVCAPVVYSAKGGETADYANRLTTVTGTPTITSGSFEVDAGTDDIKMNFTVGAKTIQVFYKANAQTADSNAFDAMKDAVENAEEITVKGFTGWYDGFQVQMNGVVEAAYGYTAEDFAQDLLDQTDAVCEDYDGHSNNHDALVTIWSNLASDDKYPSLAGSEKTKLANANIHGSTVVDRAMARYDYLTGKYNLNNFINGRTISAQPISPLEAMDNWFTPLMIIACGSCIAFVGLILIRRKRLVK